MTLQEIIDALEKADGPSRELDARIRALLLAEEGAYAAVSQINGEWCVYRGERNGIPKLYERHRNIPHELWRGEYSRSVDAAIALCERLHPNFNWAISKTGAHIFAGVDVFSGRSTSTAIAICLATLRAELGDQR